MILVSNPNGIEGTFGTLPALVLGLHNDIPNGERKTP